MRKMLFTVVKALAILVGVNGLVSFVHYRFDLTEDQRYTLSEPAIEVVKGFENPIVIDVLLGGDLPPKFERLKVETQLLLNAFALENKKISIDFVDPLENVGNIEQTIAELESLGLKRANIITEENSKVSQESVFPWAIVNYENKSVRVPLLKTKLGASLEERITNSVQHLEYAFADAFTKLGIREKKKVAILKGNGELDDIFMADYLTSIRDYYNIGAFTLDSVATNPQKTLEQLKTYDLALIAKPTEAFSEAEKYVLDQFIVQGGKSMWFIDKVAMELDSLKNIDGAALAVQRDLNLTDFFFKYGIRINPVLINDLYFTQIVLAADEGTNAQYNPLPWVYHPMVFSRNNHPINTNLEALRFQFANAIDTLSNSNKKTILLYSSPLSKKEGMPRTVTLNSINNPPKKETYTDGNNPLAVLIEGSFESAYTNRIKPLKLQGISEKGGPNKMLVVADGDIIRNQIRQGRPLELGYDKWTNNFFGNKEFLVNSINYLLDDTGLINIRTKKVAIPFLDQKRISNQRTKWQLINIGVPAIFILLFGFLFTLVRKKKYGA